jgi:hypothetical protein
MSIATIPERQQEKPELPELSAGANVLNELSLQLFKPVQHDVKLG